MTNLSTVALVFIITIGIFLLLSICGVIDALKDDRDYNEALFCGCPICNYNKVPRGLWGFSVVKTGRKKYIICHSCGWKTKPHYGKRAIMREYDNAWGKRRRQERRKKDATHNS